MQMQDERYAAAFPGWQKASLPKCPRVIAGRRCYVGDGRKVPKCICMRYHYRIFDHTRIWRTPEKQRVLVTEPYQVNAGDLADFQAECLELGLAVNLYRYSPYNPGQTLTLLIHRADQDIKHNILSQTKDPSQLYTPEIGGLKWE